MLSKRAISPVVATALLLVVAVVAVVGFQTFFNNYSSGLFSKVETQSSNSVGNTQIENLIGNSLFFKNANTENITINSVKIDGVDCNYSENVSNGITEINVSNCVSNLTTQTPEVVIFTNNIIYSKKFYVKSLNSNLVNELYCVNITTGLQGLWHLDESFPFSNGIANNISNVFSSGFNVGFDDWRAFDEGVSGGSFWEYSISPPWRIGYDFGVNNSKNINSFTLFAGDSESDRMPRVFTFQGSNDNLSWNVLGSYTSQSFVLGEIKRYYILNNTNSYRYYQLNITSTTEGTNIIRIFDINLNPDFINDSSNKQNMANPYFNTTSVLGRVNNAFYFDGIDDYMGGGIGVGNNFPAGNSSRTIMMWIKTSNVSTDTNLFQYGGAGAGGINFHIFLSNGGNFYTENGYGSGVVSSGADFDDNVWHHVVGVYEGSGNNLIRTYVDGVERNSGNPSTVPNTNLLVNWRIGKFITDIGAFNGTIDEVAIYSRNLSLTEIQQIYDYNYLGKPICNP